MSHPANTLYLEERQARFDELKDGFERATLLRELRENGFDHEAEELLQTWYDEREIYLQSVGVVEGDVMFDEEGLEYYLDEEEHGTPGDDYHFTTKEVKLPTYLNVTHWSQEAKLKNTRNDNNTNT